MRRKSVAYCQGIRILDGYLRHERNVLGRQRRLNKKPNAGTRSYYRGLIKTAAPLYLKNRRGKKRKEEKSTTIKKKKEKYEKTFRRLFPNDTRHERIIFFLNYPNKKESDFNEQIGPKRKTIMSERKI